MKPASTALIHLLLVSAVIFVARPNGSLMAQSSLSQNVRTSNGTNIVVRLNATAQCPNNILRLRDIAEVRGDTATAKRLADLPIAPTPPIGSLQEWSRAEVEKALQLRGVDVSNLQWEGLGSCRVERVAATQIVDRSEVGSAVVTAAATKESTRPTNKQFDAPNQHPGSTLVEGTQFMTAFTTPGVVAQAERIAQTAIENYLQTQTQSTAEFTVKPIIPPNLAQTILQRRQIVGIAGGQPPYEGLQTFEFLVRSPTGQEKVTIQAEIQLPEMILVSTKALPKGHWIRQEDLTCQPLPKGWKDGVQNCFTEENELVGKELKRGVSANQIFKRGDAGAPTLVEAGDAVKIELVLGAVVIETNGRAIENGGMDDLIQVETAEHKKRLLARVRSERIVDVYSNGSMPASSPASFHSQSKSRKTR
ncbi:flagellar basal body P-ring formation chaperone FlgA [Pirellulaceae bacterium SH501]